MIFTAILLSFSWCLSAATSDSSKNDTNVFYLINELPAESITIAAAKAADKEVSETTQNNITSLIGSIVSDAGTLVDGGIGELTFTISEQNYTAKIPRNIQDNTQLFFNKANNVYTLTTSDDATPKYKITLQKSTAKAPTERTQFTAMDAPEFTIPEDVSLEKLDIGQLTLEQPQKKTAQPDEAEGVSQPDAQTAGPTPSNAPGSQAN